MPKFNDGFSWAERVAQRYIEQPAHQASGIIERFNQLKDRILSPCLKPWWPRFLTANVVSLVRMGIALVLIILALLERGAYSPLCIGLLAIALLSDFLDGWVARIVDNHRTARAMSRGILLDKLADRVLLVPFGVITFWPVDRWLVVLSLIGITFTMLFPVINFLRQQPLEVPGNNFGKVAMVLFAASIFLALVAPSYLWLADRIGWSGLMLGLISVISGFHRLYRVIIGSSDA